MQCGKCGRSNPAGSRFCLGCGAPLSPGQPGVRPFAGQPPMPPAYSQTARPPAKKRRCGVIALSVLAGVLAIGLILALLLSGGRVRTETVSGGTVTMDGVTLDFGDNAVADSEASVSNVVFGRNDEPQGLVSTQLALDCDAENLGDPVSVAYRLPEEAAQGAKDILLGVGLDYTGKYGSTGTYLAFIAAEVQDGTAYAEFVPADCLSLLDTVKAAGGTVSIPADMVIKLGWYAYNSYTLKQSEVHFELYVPLDINAGKRQRYQLQPTDVKAILDDLESAYDFYRSKGFAYEGRKDWPIDVYISDDMGAAEEGLFSMPWYSDSPDSGTLYFNAKLFDWGYPEGGIKQLIYHEFFHFVQQNYVTSDTYSLWIDEATATYYESAPYGKSPMIIADYRYNLLQSIYPDTSTGTEGYARAPLFWYLSRRYGDDIVLKLYEYGARTELTASPENWLKELTVLTDEPVLYATDFYKTLLTEGFGTKQNYFSAKGVYDYVSNSSFRDAEENPLAGGKPLEVYLPDEAALTSLLQQGQSSTLVGQTTLHVHTAGAQFAPLVFRELYDRVREGMDPVLTIDNPNCEMTVFYIDQYAADKYKVMACSTGNEVRLTDFRNLVIDGADPLFLVMVTGLQRETWTDCTVSVTALLSPDMLPDAGPGISPGDGPNGDGTTSPLVSAAPSPSAQPAEDPCADAPPEVAGVQIDRFYDPTPNARSGSISQAPDMRIEAFNIIGGRLTEPDISNNVNETFTYLNNGYCTAGETVGLQMVASARDREHDSIEYNILENKLTMRITFYDKDGHIIGTPLEQASPEDGKEHTIGDTISAVVPDNAASVNIMGYFNHRYGSYGDYHSASVGIDINFAVTDFEVNASAVQTDMIDTSAVIPDNADDEDSEQFWGSMKGVWMCYNAVGEVEYFVFTGSGGGKALTVGTVETGRSEPSEAVAVSKYDETTYEVVYRFEGVDYKLYFEVSELDYGTVYYAAHSPAGYRAFDYTGSNLSEAMIYYNAYYAAG